MAGAVKLGCDAALIYMRRKCFISLEIPVRDKSYQWVMQWLVQRTTAIGAVKNTRASASWHHTSVETSNKLPTDGVSGSHGGKPTCTFDFVPAPGRHFLKLKPWQFLMVERERTQSGFSQNPFESIKLTTLAYPNGPGLFREILDQAQDLAVEKEDGKTVIYKPDCVYDWEASGNPREIREFDSVILDARIAEDIADDLREFANSRSWYTERG